MAPRRGAAPWAWACLAAATLLQAGGLARGDCWLIEGDKGFVWLAICSQNQPPYEAIPQHINSTVVDLRLNENRIHGVPQAALSRFGNLTYLNLTKNEIAYIEDGAFAGQFQLQVLQLGYNRLRRLTEGALRGLGRLEYLYLQANRIEAVAPGAFAGCPNVLNIDLSMNRIQRLHGATFAGLARLSACELYSNPFFCSCELLAFLRWLAAFANATHTHDRVQCEAPPPYAGYFLLGRGPGQRGVLATLQAVCTDGAYAAESPPPQAPEPPPPAPPGPVRPPPPSPPPPLEPEASETPCAAAEDCFSGDGGGGGTTTALAALPTRAAPAEARPLLRVKQLTPDSATLAVQLPSPFTRVYTLEHFNHSRPATVLRLTRPLQEVRLPRLAPLTDHTYCVVSASGAGLRHNHSCLTLRLPPPPPSPPRPGPGPGPGPATATHYIMTVLGCLFGMVLVLGAVYYGLRRRRRRCGEKHQPAAGGGGLKKTILELQYGPELEVPGLAPLAPGALLGPEPATRLPFMPVAPGGGGGSEVGEPYPPLPPAVVETETPKAAKGTYLEVRTGEPAARPGAGGQGSVTEISTITKEVDKVNQIINNCIDALKAEAAAEPQLVLLAEPLAGKHGFLSPVYPDAFGHGLALPPATSRHHGVGEGAPGPARTSTSSSSSSRSPRAFGASAEPAGAHKAAAAASEAKYIEKGSPAADAILTVTPEAAVLRAEAEKGRAYGEHHRHSYPGPRPAEPPSPPPPAATLPPEGPGGRKASLLEPLTRARPRDPAYSPLSPRYRHLRYAPGSPPEAPAPCRAAPGIWERLRLSRRRRKDGGECVAAGHALRKKVQFAKDEDLHDILDYWKGVSAQHKS